MKKLYSVNVYYIQGEKNKLVAPNFKVSEFACNDKSAVCFVNPKLAELLQKIRTKAGAPIIINSAYRTVAYNTKVGGAANSQHIYGNAADICCKTLSPNQLKAIAESIMGNSGGIGIYPTFLHVDVREIPSRWKG